MAEAAADHTPHDELIASTRGVVLFLLAVVVVIAAVIYGMFAIGPWVLGVTAVATVPVIYVVLILLTMGQ
ncbi:MULTISPECIES: hypothetical protein [Celeribacter]|jgi:type IV secretory pathway VirB2 component (pilin)|uniref:Uncharacterized protein n=1 Tax=Celeribacter halophilus TaxID=576117 RepID=A0A1I3W020_9RHOB|nr:hypothetical protein [Celeribacter halophilus]MDO6458696.1 hypothetical protein [Celeribacter halophilus]MDO6722454.1 hypothetical protein [Celeribacter halophilus]PZX06831.1 hypothetical protein LX82_03289 [Celeribacter halophilus]SFK00825.1 hypothetical protein SAMN04488138_11927 [Celeribacter halophilus]